MPPRSRNHCEIVENMIRGEVPEWYTDNYSDDSGKLWSDIITYTTFGDTRVQRHELAGKHTILHAFAGEFGGYCSARVANDAMHDVNTTITNPWVDGGCEPDAPSSVSVTAGGTAGTFTVSWSAPDSAGGATLSGYEVHWKVGFDGFSDTRSQSVGATATSATVDTGSGTSVRIFRVRAINEIGESVGVEAGCYDEEGTWECVSLSRRSSVTRGHPGETRFWPADPRTPDSSQVLAG